MDFEEIKQTMREAYGVVICVAVVMLLKGSLCALTREEIISTAQSYANESWDCNEWNIEPKPRAPTIDRRPNWPFSAGNSYPGIPYGYGCKDSKDAFKNKIAISGEGENYIGGKDKLEIEKDFKGTIKGYAGIDCSGLVSYAYGRTGAQMWGTQTLPASFVQIEDPHAIEKGDVLSWYDYHCMLYESGNIDGTINTYHAVTGAFGSSKRVQRVIFDENIQSKVDRGLVILKCQSADSSERPFKAYTAAPVFLNNVYPSKQITVDPSNPQIIPIGIYIASKKDGITDITSVEGSINGVPGTIDKKRLNGDNERVLVTCTPNAVFHQGTYYFTVTATNQLGLSKSTFYAFDVIEKKSDGSDIDSDYDGMDDSWEKHYFGDTSQPWDGDFDGDGYTNLDEFLMGSDPRDANSPPKKKDRKYDNPRDKEYGEHGGAQKTAVKDHHILTSQDPNSMQGPAGSITAGQQLTYTVSFENVGTGIAYGVYITDKFDSNIDDTMVQVSNCRRVDYTGGNETSATFTHTYDPQTRLLSVFIDNEGEVGSKQGGKFDITVCAKSTLAEGSVVSNYATVYFPSAPEVTPTNTVVSVVPKRTDIQYTGKTIVEYSDTLEATTALGDLNNTAIQSQPVMFVINNSSYTQTTTDNGSAYMAVDTRDILPGDYAVCVEYAGDGCYYLPSHSAGTVKVLKKRCLMTKPDCSYVLGSSATVVVGLCDNYNRELLHQADDPKTIYLEYRDSGTWKSLSQTVLDKSSATFTFAFPERPKQKAYPLRARFAGDNRYEGIMSEGNLTFVDTIAPVIAISSPVAGQQYGAASAAIPVHFTVLDNLDPAPTVVACFVNLEKGTSMQVYNDQAIGSVNIDSGTWMMTVQAMDWAGNISTAAIAAFEVTHAANLPVLTIPGDIIIEATGAGTAVSIGTATATGVLPVTITNNAPTSFVLGVTTVTWTATDGDGRTVSKNQRVTVIDTTPPQITLITPVGGEKFIVGISTLMVSYAICDADSQPVVQSFLFNTISTTSIAVSNGQVVNLQTVAAGFWTLNVTAIDWAGHTSSGTSGLFEIVRDTTAPVTTIALIGRTMSLSASDDLSGVFQTLYRVNAGSWVTYVSPVILASTATTVDYYSTDKAGNQEQMHQYIFIGDTTKPTVIETYPRNNGRLDIKKYGGVRIVFSEPVKSADWTTDVVVSETKDRKLKDYSVTYDSATCAVLITGKFKNNTQYTITLKNGIADRANNKLDQYTCSFQTFMSHKEGGTFEDKDTGLIIIVAPNALPCDGYFDVTVLDNVRLPRLPKPFEWLCEGRKAYQILFRDANDRIVEEQVKQAFKLVIILRNGWIALSQSKTNSDQKPMDIKNMKLYQVGTVGDAVQFAQRRAQAPGTTVPVAIVSETISNPMIAPNQSSNETSQELSAEVSSFGIFTAAGFMAPSGSLDDLSCYPSPFKPPHQSVTVQYYLASAGNVSIAIYDLLGNLVKTWEIPSGSPGAQSGINQLPWDGRNGQGDVVANGGYVVMVNTTDRTKRFKLLVIK